jgi:hypothetical protein
MEQDVYELSDEGESEGCCSTSASSSRDADKSPDKSQKLVKVKKAGWAWEYIYLLKDGPIIKNKIEYHYACKPCLDQPHSKLSDCLIKLHKHNISNGIAHIKKYHQNLVPKQQTPVAKIQISQESTPCTSRKIMDNFVQLGNDSVIKRVHFLVARFIINARLPLSLALNEDLTSAFEAASHVRAGTYSPMSTRALDGYIVSMFSSFIEDVSVLVATTRALYTSADGITHGWLTVCHDGWDSDSRQYFGVSIFFINPSTWLRYGLSVGMATPESHGAEECATAIKDVLSRYGIVQSDIFARVNDTTSASVATGRILAGEDGTCIMHVSNLVADHATGKRTRRKGGAVVDEFPECEMLRKKVASLIKYITSKKAKARWKSYRSRNKVVGQKVIRLSLDNDTRISGTIRMYQQVLRSRYTIRTFFNQESDSVAAEHNLSTDEWAEIAGFEAVLRPICNLSFLSQTDSRSITGISWLQIVM